MSAVAISASRQGRFVIPLNFKIGCRLVSNEDDRECSEEPQDTCDSLERSIVQIGLATAEIRVENETQIAACRRGQVAIEQALLSSATTEAVPIFAPARVKVHIKNKAFCVKRFNAGTLPSLSLFLSKRVRILDASRGDGEEKVGLGQRLCVVVRTLQIRPLGRERRGQHHRVHALLRQKPPLH